MFLTSSLILSIITVLIQEYFLTNSLVQTFYWAVSHWEAFLLSCLIAFTFYSTLSCFFQSRKIIIIASLSLISLGVISFIKQRTLGLPIYPWDFNVIKETLEVSLVILNKNPYLSFLSLIPLSLLLGFYLIPKKTKSYNWRIIPLGFLNLIILLILLLANNPIHDYLFHNKFKFYTSDKAEGFNDRGLIISFIALIERGVLVPPVSYQEGEVVDLLKNEQKLKIPSNLAPDVIVIMSESLFDPLELSGIEWVVDPLKFTRSVNNRPLSFAKVPTYGGKTANSEFEFLTGHSLKFFSPGTVPYELLTSSPTESIVRSFKSEGYKTIAIHPGTKTFWNRDQVYQGLGFDKFIYQDLFKSPEVVGNFISDASILPELKDSLSKIKSPSFHFIVTIQNHMPYSPNSFDLSSPLFKKDNVSVSDQVILNYYTKMIQKTDEFHRDLITFLKSRNRPTILVIFGDHLPPLKENYQILKDYKMVSGNLSAPSDKKKLYTTPLVVWSNFSQNLVSKPINLNFLGVKLLKEIGISLTPYQNYVLRVSESTENFTEASELNPLIRNYHAMQYFILTHDLEEEKLLTSK